MGFPLFCQQDLDRCRTNRTTRQRHLSRTYPLSEGYTDTDVSRGGHRSLIAPGGVKKLGREVLGDRVAGTVVTGTVRLRLEQDDVRTFHLDLKTHTVSLADRVQEAAR